MSGRVTTAVAYVIRVVYCYAVVDDVVIMVAYYYAVVVVVVDCGYSGDDAV